jgi:hypothetical protein
MIHGGKWYAFTICEHTAFVLSSLVELIIQDLGEFQTVYEGEEEERVELS